MEIKSKLIKNFSTGRAGYKPEAIVIHIADGWLEGAYSWFNNPASQASSHYMIGKSGEVWKFVEEENTAWHTGNPNKPTWVSLKQGVDPNLYTIGIEHEGFSSDIITESMYKSSSELLANIAKKYSLNLNRNTVVGHNEINSVNRANCPGKGLDINKLIDFANLILNEENPEMIKQLQQQIDTLKNDILKFQTTIEDLKNSLNRETANTSQLNMQIQQNKSIYEQEKKRLQSDKQKLSTEVKDLQISQSNLNKIIANLRSEISKLKISNMGKILGIDFGTKKFGLSISDENEMFAQRLAILEVSNIKDSSQKVNEIINNNSISKVLLGLPLDDFQNETATSKKVKVFVSFLKKLTDIPIVFWNESFTTQLSKINVKEQKYKRGNLDSEAARMMLQEFLDSNYYKKINEGINI